MTKHAYLQGKRAFEVSLAGYHIIIYSTSSPNSSCVHYAQQRLPYF